MHMEHARQLVQVRREHALHGNIVLKELLGKSRKNKTTCFGKLYSQTLKRCFSWEKVGSAVKDQLFPRKKDGLGMFWMRIFLGEKMVLDRKTNA